MISLTLLIKFFLLVSDWQKLLIRSPLSPPPNSPLLSATSKPTGHMFENLLPPTFGVYISMLTQGLYLSVESELQEARG